MKREFVNNMTQEQVDSMTDKEFVEFLKKECERSVILAKRLSTVMSNEEISLSAAILTLRIMDKIIELKFPEDYAEAKIAAEKVFNNNLSITQIPIN